MGSSVEEVIHRPEFKNWTVKELKSWEALRGEGKTTLFKATLEPPQRNAEWVVDQLKEILKSKSPKPSKKKLIGSGEKMLEIDIFDLHIGKKAISEESGEEYDSQKAVDIASAAVDSFIARSSRVGLIILPVGNDLLNVDSTSNTTTKGTPQDVDTRWTDQIRIAKDFCFSVIDTLRAIAPVHVPCISGNHDYHSIVALGDILEAKYADVDNVIIDNSRYPRKYYQFGVNLIGFTHGCHESNKALRALMPAEAPELWGRTTHREWHLGDKHVENVVETDGGITIRVIPSLSANDYWHTQKGYVDNPKAQAFVWDDTNGLEAIYYYNA